MPLSNRHVALERWVIHTWPSILLKSGYALFWLSCLFSARLPTAALFIGPGLMVSGVILREWQRRASRP